MEAFPIDVDEKKNARFYADKECAAILEYYPDFYQRVGFHPPWIGYFFKSGRRMVGAAGFKGPPREGWVEISYGTFREFEGRGIATVMCHWLVNLSLKTDAQVRITARTLPVSNASGRVLQKCGFVWKGPVVDAEDGDVWEWEYGISSQP